MTSYIRQETQLGPSDTYSDAVAAGATMESAPVNIEDDLNSLRSQIARYTGETNWYDDVSGRTIVGLGTDLDDLEDKPLLFRTQILTDVTVGNGENFVILSVSGSETPTPDASVGAATTEGAIVAFHTGTFGTHALDEVTGQNATQPKNLCIVRNAANGNVIQSASRDVYALIQSEIVTNGHTFNDTTQQVQLSFVRQTAGFDDLEACPVADIEDLDINYSYAQRIFFDNVPESAFLHGGFVDQSAAVDVTLDNAIDNQSGPATQGQDIDVRITDTYGWAFQDSTGGVDIMKISAEVAGDVAQFNVATFDVNNSNSADFLNGVIADSGGTAINVGVTAGQVDSAGALKLLSAAAGNLTIEAAGEIILDDVNKPGTFAADLKLSEIAGDWTAYETAFGEVSLLNALVQADAASTTRTRAFATVQNGPHAAGVNITGAGATPELDTQLTNYSAMTFITDVDIFHNGQLQVNAAAATEDVYPGDAPATGDFKSTRKMKDGDKIIMITWG